MPFTIVGVRKLPPLLNDRVVGKLKLNEVAVGDSSSPVNPAVPAVGSTL